MARVPITEHKAKQLLLGESYVGVRIITPTDKTIKKLPLSPKQKYVVKVDQATKKRMKQGLARVNVTAREAAQVIATWRKKGFTSFLAESVVAHESSEEQYLCFERSRHGIVVTYSPNGGVDIEENAATVQRYEFRVPQDWISFAKHVHVPSQFLERVQKLFSEAHCSLIELNPIIVRDGVSIPLDAAILVDDTADASVYWDENDIVRPPTQKNSYEERVERLARTTPASLKLRVMNPNGSLFFLLSGGGGSLAIVDAVYEQGKAALIGNYGEYSGGPTQEETYLYSKTVLELLIASKAKQKVLVIAGGIANFTDIKATFAGIIEAIDGYADVFKKQKIAIAVRRGGPREKEGLELLGLFLKEKGIRFTLHGSDALITAAIDDALQFIHQ